MQADGAPRTREELAERLGDLRRQGILDTAEEDRLLRHYDALLRDVNEEKARLEPEYNRRVREQGLEPANAWLRDAAQDLGRRHGEATRVITDQLRVVTG
ncbi:hypothetical protein H5368_10040 [Luteimonas sp. MC1782]|uniref:hypothetical protein n=1 Tax=Luteimonas sp. MC1782 TaxID=2760305 RepID=UPI001601D3C4|nr:hypothetical protein [Luteimonas sp. MC1782]MBB1473374.1 hypothetical protein [Luteimonas sp. MC1782]